MPKYQHDCQECVFLGRHGPTDADLYFCEQMGHPTVIARYSDEPSDYSSGLLGTIPEIKMAKLLAWERSLITTKQFVEGY